MKNKKKALWLTVMSLLAFLVNVACTAESSRPALLPTEEVTMFVGSERVECEGVAPQTCLLVKFDPESESELFYDSIIGFEYEAGFEYELRVKKSQIENPRADASSIQYELVEMVSKTAMTEGNESGSNDQLAGSSWLLVSYGPENAPMKVLPNTEISVEFKAGNIEGSAGCNDFFGVYEIKQESISIGEVAQTEIGCLDEKVMEQEMAFTEALIEAKSFTIEGETLTMSDENGVLRFTAMSAPANLSLEATAWQLSTFIQDETASSLLVDTQITAEFADGQINGTAGCNHYFGSYEIDGDNITFSDFGTTRKACPNEIMEQERSYLAALQTAERITIDGQTLTITHANGEFVFNVN